MNTSRILQFDLVLIPYPLLGKIWLFKQTAPSCVIIDFLNVLLSWIILDVHLRVEGEIQATHISGAVAKILRKLWLKEENFHKDKNLYI
jgi:hypothetical protein